MASEETYVADTDYTVNYKTARPVPIPEIIDSLVAHRNIIQRTGPFIEKAYDGIVVRDIEVYLQSLESGSLKEHFAIRYLLGGAENCDNVEALIERILRDSPVLRTATAVGVGALIGAGIVSALPVNTPVPNISAHNNTIINIGASVDLRSDEIQAIIDGTKNRKQLAKDAISAVRPAQHDNAEIEVEGIPELSMPTEAVAESPREFVPQEPEEKSVSHANVPVVVYASDRDNTERGWAGIVPNIVDRRVRFVLAEGVDPRKLHGRTRLNADVVVHSKYVPSKKRYEVNQVEIRRIN